jgi:hypothetical protein
MRKSETFSMRTFTAFHGRPKDTSKIFITFQGFVLRHHHPTEQTSFSERPDHFFFQCVQLANLSAHHPQVRFAMISKGCVQPLLDVAKGNGTFDFENQRASLVALTNLSIEPESKATMVDNGCLDQLLAMAQAPPEMNDFRAECQTLTLKAILSIADSVPGCRVVCVCVCVCVCV